MYCKILCTIEEEERDRRTDISILTLSKQVRKVVVYFRKRKKLWGTLNGIGITDKDGRRREP